MFPRHRSFDQFFFADLKADADSLYKQSVSHFRRFPFIRPKSINIRNHFILFIFEFSNIAPRRDIALADK